MIDRTNNSNVGRQPVDVQIGLRIKEALRTSGVSEEQAAAGLGMTAEELKISIAGQVRVPAATLVALAHLTRRRVSWFFT
jgi:hypothetical protein